MIRSMRSSMQLGNIRVFIVPAMSFLNGRSISSLTGHGGFMHDVLVHQLVLWVFLFSDIPLQQIPSFLYILYIRGFPKRKSFEECLKSFDSLDHEYR